MFENMSPLHPQSPPAGVCCVSEESVTWHSMLSLAYAICASHSGALRQWHVQ
jgi:hypothetical protein